MPLYFFDIHHGVAFARDDIGCECDDMNAIRREVMRVLPSIDRDERPPHGDRQAFAVLVRDENGRNVYTAALTFTALSLGAETVTPMKKGTPVCLSPT